MRISKQTKKTTLAQQGRYLLICLLSMLLLFLAGSVLILNRTQRGRYMSSWKRFQSCIRMSWITVFFESAETCSRL